MPTSLTLVAQLDGTPAPAGAGTWETDHPLYVTVTDTSAATGLTSATVTPIQATPAGVPAVVRVTITDSGAEAEVEIEVAAAPAPDPDPPPVPPVADPGGPYAGTEGLSISFDGSGSTDPDGDAATLTYRWVWGDGTPDGTGATPTHAYAVRGSYAGSLTVTDAQGQTHTAPFGVTVSPAPLPPPPPPPVGSGHFPNAPTGWQTVADRGFASAAASAADAAGAEGWFAGYEGQPAYVANRVVVQDPTAPISPGSVLRVLYQTGFQGGVSPWAGAPPWPTWARRREVYDSFAIKLSSGFYGHPGSTNKIRFWKPDNRGDLFLSAEGSGLNPLYVEMRYQGPVGSVPTHMRGNQPGYVNVQWPRVPWILFEVRIYLNTPGSADGWFKVWMDVGATGSSVLTHHYTGLEIVPPANAGLFTDVTVTPVWGGGAFLDPPANTQPVLVPAPGHHFDLDHVRVMVP
jgi:PKD repeat protein